MNTEISVLLIGNYASDLQPSMRRYAAGMMRGLQECMPPENVHLLTAPRLYTPFRSQILSQQFLDKFSRHSWNYLYSGGTIYHHLAQKKSSIVHVLDHSHAAILLALPRHLRTVVTCHDLIPLKLLSGRLSGDIKPTFIQERLFRLSMMGLKKADHIICVSKATQEDVIELLNIPRERTSVVYSPVDFPSISHHSQKNLRTNGIFHILSVGGSLTYKNHHRALTAVTEILRQNIPIKLHIIGRTLSDDEKNVLNTTGLLENTIITPRATDEELLQAYTNSDVLLFPSLYEGYGWPPLEAFMCGCPVVLSPAGALAEIAAKYGRVCDPLSITSIRDALLDVFYHHDQWVTKALAASQFLSQLTWQKAAQHIISQYLDLNRVNHS
jgi:glycosyltransferase involved in cell wall biosynthesis